MTAGSTNSTESPSFANVDENKAKIWVLLGFEVEPCSSVLDSSGNSKIRTAKEYCKIYIYGQFHVNVPQGIFMKLVKWHQKLV